MNIIYITQTAQNSQTDNVKCRNIPRRNNPMKHGCGHKKGSAVRAPFVKSVLNCRNSYFVIFSIAARKSAYTSALLVSFRIS